MVFARTAHSLVDSSPRRRFHVLIPGISQAREIYLSPIFLSGKETTMRTPASIAGHPLHPMLIVFPVGLLVFSLICDLASFFFDNPTTWATVALYTMIGGFVGALVAAGPGRGGGGARAEA